MATALQLRVKQLLEMKGVDSPEVAEALAFVGAVGITGPGGTRQLRSILETRAIENAKEFIASYEGLRAALDAADAEASALRAEAESLCERAARAEAEAAALLEQSDALAAQRDVARGCSALADAFAARYRLTLDEQRALTRDDVGPGFLAALRRAQAIRLDCKQLLQSNHHRVGVDIMSEMSALIEDSLWKLSRWARSAIAADLSLGDPLLRPALAALRMSEGFQLCLDELGAQRGKAVGLAFVAALTVGGTGRPIEIHSHDPLRYVGDMLAWIHQAVASEFELVSSLLAPESADQQALATTRPAAAPAAKTGVEAEVQGVLEREFEGLCRPFKVRLEQVLALGQGPVTLFKLAGVLGFYSRIIGDLLGPRSPLPATVSLCEKTTLEAFHEQLRGIVAKLAEAPPIPPADLSAPAQARDVSALLGELVGAVRSSIVPQDESRRELAPALSLVIEPLAEVFSASAAAAKLDPTSTAVFSLNALSSLAAPLCSQVEGPSQGAVVAADPAAEAAVVRIQELIAGHIGALVDEQAARFLTDCGIAQKLAIARHLDAVSSGQQGPLSGVLGLEPRAIEVTARSFESALLDVGSALLLPHVDRLLNPRFRATIRQGVAEQIAKSYTELWSLVTAGSSGYPDRGARLFRYKPDQIKTLLDV